MKFVERSRPGVQVSTSSFSSGGSIITDYLLLTIQIEKIFRGFLSFLESFAVFFCL